MHCCNAATSSLHSDGMDECLETATLVIYRLNHRNQSFATLAGIVPNWIHPAKSNFSSAQMQMLYIPTIKTGAFTCRCILFFPLSRQSVRVKHLIFLGDRHVQPPIFHGSYSVQHLTFESIMTSIIRRSSKKPRCLLPHISSVHHTPPLTFRGGQQVPHEGEHDDNCHQRVLDITAEPVLMSSGQHQQAAH